MRLYIHGNKKRFRHALLLFFLVTVLLPPSVHSHAIIVPDDGKIHQDLTLKVAVTHNHVALHAWEWPSENLIAPCANFTDFSWHDHDSNQHFHYPENQLLKVKKGAGGTKDHKSFFPQTVSLNLTFKKIPCKISNQLSPITPPTHLEFVLIATDLPPPTA